MVVEVSLVFHHDNLLQTEWSIDKVGREGEEGGGVGGSVTGGVVAWNATVPNNRKCFKCRFFFLCSSFYCTQVHLFTC